ncbi:MAG: ABC transporter permease [Planctomycetes bacterium]|nr:ABC transporter permease [Planctomycetota bacterium]
MSLTSFIVCRNWASSWLRLLLTLSGIALGVAIVVAIYVMDFNTIQSQRLRHDPERGRVDLEVRPIDALRPVDAVVARLRGCAGVADVGVWQQAQGELAAGSQVVDVAVFGLGESRGSSFAHYVLNRGRDLGPGDADPASPGILLGSEAARQLGVDVGATVQLREPTRRERPECRDGKLVMVKVAEGAAPFATAATVVGVLEPQRLGKRNLSQVVVAALPVAARLLPVGAPAYQLLGEEGRDLDRLRRELGGEFTVLDARSAMIGEGADERAFRNGLKVLGGLALLLGMFVVFQTLSHSLVARVRQLGLLRCLGTGTGAITRIFLLDALLLGVLGAALGVGLGLLLALVLQHFHISSLGAGKPWQTFDVPMFQVVWTALLGVLFTLAGAMFPLVRARQVPALDILQARGLAPGSDDGIDLLRSVNLWLFGLLVLALPLAYLAMTPLAAEESAETRMVLLQLGGMLGLFGTVLLLAPPVTACLGRALLLPARGLSTMAGWLTAKVVSRAAGRIAAAVCGLAAVMLALLGLKTVTASLRGEVREFAQQAIDDRMFVSCAPVTAAHAQRLAEVPGVRLVEAYAGEEQGGGFILRGLDLETAAAPGGPLETAGSPVMRRYADPQVRTLVASHRLAKTRQWREGDLVSLRDRNGTPVAYEVLLISDRAGFDGDERAFAITSPTWMRRDFCIAEAAVERLVLRLEPGADFAAITAAARTMLPGLRTSKLGDHIREYFVRDVARDFELFDLLLLLMMVLAGVGLLNGMTIAALGRVRELGVLRALGITRGALVGSFLLEGAVVAMLASLMALLLAVPMGHVLVLGMNVVAGLDAPVVLPYRWFVLAPLAALGTALVAAMVPAQRALRQSPSESVRYE